MNDSLPNTAGAEVVKRGPMFSLLRAAEVVDSRLEGELSQVGLSMAKYSVLSELAVTAEPVALCELANRLSCVRSNITQLIDRLEADGMVRRVADPSDRRSVRAALTALGTERYAAGRCIVEQLQDDFARRVGEADRACLETVLAAIE